jgi:hypothetical protein
MMAKAYLLTVKEINKRRAANWEFHYAQRTYARQAAASVDVDHIARAIQRNIPAPELLVDGSILSGIEEIRGIQAALIALHWNYTQRDLLCIWYWKDEYFQDFTRAFQSLPEVFTPYQYAYDEEKDALRFIPTTKGEVWGKSGGSRASSPNSGGKTVTEAGVAESSPTNGIVPPQFPRSSPAVPPTRK